MYLVRNLFLVFFVFFSQLSLAATPKLDVLNAGLPNASPTTLESANGEKINAAYWLKRLQTALTESNFEAGIVTIKGSKTESYQWTHGFFSEESGKSVEIERVSPLIGNGIAIIRKNDTLSYFEANKLYCQCGERLWRRFIRVKFYVKSRA